MSNVWLQRTATKHAMSFNPVDAALLLLRNAATRGTVAAGPDAMLLCIVFAT